MERAREALLDGLANAIAGLHRQEKAIRERLDAHGVGPDAGPAPNPQGAPEAAAPPGNEGAARSHAPAEAPRVQVGDDQMLGEMLFDLIRLELRVLDQLTTVSLRNADRLIAYLQRNGEPLRRPPAAPEPVRIAGRPGTSTRTRFVVDNPGLRDAEVRIRASDFTPEGGGAPFRGEVAVRPDAARLAPRQEVEVEVEVEVDGRFDSPGRYHLEIEVLAAGRPRRALPLVLEVERAPRPRRDGPTVRKRPQRRKKV